MDITEELPLIPESAPPASDEQTSGIIRIPGQDKARLEEAIRELLAHGSILGLEAGRTDLYQWCRRNFEWLREAAALLGLEVSLLHEERLVQALPRVPSLRLNLRQDATLVWLALWYAGDVRWRDEGEAQAFLSVAELNSLLKDQLLPDSLGLLSRGRLREILRQAARYHLIRFSPSEPFEESGIEILPAIRRVIPFRDLAAWAESAASFRIPESTPEDDEDESGDPNDQPTESGDPEP